MTVSSTQATSARTPVRFAPVVHLPTHTVAGFEVSAAPPDDRTAADLDLQDTAVAAISATDLPADLSWLLTVDPTDAGRLADRARSMHLGVGREPLNIVAEIRDHDLAEEPGTLFEFVSAARRQGWSVALDVGRNPDSLALLPLIEPEVVKVDLDHVEARTGDGAVDIGYPIRAYAEATGTVVMAKGVDTGRRLELAQLVGATFGEGALFGSPGDLPDTLPRPRKTLQVPARDHDRLVRTPFHIVSDVHHPAMATKRVLVELSRQIEVQAAASGASHVCLGAFQHVDHWTARSRSTFEALGRANLFTRVFAAGITADPAPGIRGTTLLAGDRLAKEWAVVVLGPHYAAALVALDLGDPVGAAYDRRFQYVVTHDRALVTEVARDLLRRSGDDPY